MCLGVPGKVVELLESQMATVDVNGNQTQISVRLTPEVKLGQYVMIHAGFAVEIMDEGVALETMKYLLEML